jgi:hypothetical protein
MFFDTVFDADYSLVFSDTREFTRLWLAEQKSVYKLVVRLGDERRIMSAAEYLREK